jgi:hypothetical protein
MTSTGDPTRPRPSPRRPAGARARARPKPPEPASDDAEARPRTSRGVGEKRARLNDRLIIELRALRATLTQCLDAFDLSVGGRIAELLQTLEGDDALDQRPRPLTVKNAQAALAEIAELEVTPKKAPRRLIPRPLL